MSGKGPSCQPLANSQHLCIAAIGVLFFTGAIVLIALYRERLNHVIDRLHIFAQVTPLVILCLGALILNATQKKKWLMVHAMHDVNKFAESMMKLIADFTKVPLQPPLQFYYIDRPQVDALFAQIEPDLTERSRTEKRGTKRTGTASLDMGAAKTSAEIGAETESSSQYERTASSPERRVMTLMNFCLESRRAVILRDRASLVAHDYAIKAQELMGELQQATSNMLNPSIDSEVDRLNTEMQELQARVETEVDSILENPPDLVLLDLPTARSEVHDSTVQLLGSVNRKTDTLAVTVLLPREAGLPLSKDSGVHGLKIFGHVTGRPEGSVSNLTIRALAVF